MPSPPLTLTLQSTKPSLLAGEALILDVEYRVHQGLRMAYVPLNEGRTRVWVAPLIGPPVALSARHHRALHAIHPFAPLDRWLDVAAGRIWTNFLDLSQYARAFPVGRHRVSISYRYGDSVEHTVESNEVVVEVVPAVAVGLARRWVPRTNPRALLGSVVVLRHGDAAQETSWMYRVARAHDPTALTVATRFEGGGPTADRPALAQPDRHAHVDYPHIAVWTELGELRWALVRRTGRYRDIGSLPHGLVSARLVEPPLHLAGLCLRALVAGVDPSGATGVFVAEVKTQDERDDLPLFTSSGRFEPLGAFDPTKAVVVWTLDREPILFVVAIERSSGASRIIRHDVTSRQHQTIWTGQDEVVALYEDAGSASVVALVRGRQAADQVTVWRGEAGNDALVQQEAHDLSDVGVRQIVDAAPQQSIERGGSLVLLLRTPGGWRALHGTARWEIPFDAAPLDRPPILVASGRGISLLVPHPDRAFERIILVPEPA